MSQVQASCFPGFSNYLDKYIQYFELSLYVLQAIKIGAIVSNYELETGNLELF
jgi:hypothetical protein